MNPTVSKFSEYLWLNWGVAMAEKPRDEHMERALGRIKGVIQDHTDFTVGPRTYEEGTGKIKAETDKVEIDITVKPKETSE